jgi:hypothetical protein
MEKRSTVDNLTLDVFAHPLEAPAGTPGSVSAEIEKSAAQDVGESAEVTKARDPNLVSS